jgi:ABC-type multidrug transport system permease subunit
MLVRIPYILPLLPIENTMKGFSNIAYRGMSIWESIDVILYLLGFSTVFFLITLIYLRRKKEYV